MEVIDVLKEIFEVGKSIKNAFSSYNELPDEANQLLSKIDSLFPVVNEVQNIVRTQDGTVFETSLMNLNSCLQETRRIIKEFFMKRNRQTKIVGVLSHLILGSSALEVFQDQTKKIDSFSTSLNVALSAFSASHQLKQTKVSDIIQDASALKFWVKYFGQEREVSWHRFKEALICEYPRSFRSNEAICVIKRRIDTGRDHSVSCIEFNDCTRSIGLPQSFTTLVEIAREGEPKLRMMFPDEMPIEDFVHAVVEKMTEDTGPCGKAEKVIELLHEHWLMNVGHLRALPHSRWETLGIPLRLVDPLHHALYEVVCRWIPNDVGLVILIRMQKNKAVDTDVLNEANRKLALLGEDVAMVEGQMAEIHTRRLLSEYRALDAVLDTLVRYNADDVVVAASKALSSILKFGVKFEDAPERVLSKIAILGTSAIPLEVLQPVVDVWDQLCQQDAFVVQRPHLLLLALERFRYAVETREERRLALKYRQAIEKTQLSLSATRKRSRLRSVREAKYKLKSGDKKITSRAVRVFEGEVDDMSNKQLELVVGTTLGGIAHLFQEWYFEGFDDLGDMESLAGVGVEGEAAAPPTAPPRPSPVSLLKSHLLKVEYERANQMRARRGGKRGGGRKKNAGNSSESESSDSDSDSEEDVDEIQTYAVGRGIKVFQETYGLEYMFTDLELASIKEEFLTTFCQTIQNKVVAFLNARPESQEYARDAFFILSMTLPQTIELAKSYAALEELDLPYISHVVLDGLEGITTEEAVGWAFKALHAIVDSVNSHPALSPSQKKVLLDEVVSQAVKSRLRTRFLDALIIIDYEEDFLDSCLHFMHACVASAKFGVSGLLKVLEWNGSSGIQYINECLNQQYSDPAFALYSQFSFLRGALAREQIVAKKSAEEAAEKKKKKKKGKEEVSPPPHPLRHLLVCGGLVEAAVSALNTLPCFQDDVLQPALARGADNLKAVHEAVELFLLLATPVAPENSSAKEDGCALALLAEHDQFAANLFVLLREIPPSRPEYTKAIIALLEQFQANDIFLNNLSSFTRSLSSAVFAILPKQMQELAAKPASVLPPEPTETWVPFEATDTDIHTKYDNFSGHLCRKIEKGGVFTSKMKLLKRWAVLREGKLYLWTSSRMRGKVKSVFDLAAIVTNPTTKATTIEACEVEIKPSDLLTLRIVGGNLTSPLVLTIPTDEGGEERDVWVSAIESHILKACNRLETELKMNEENALHDEKDEDLESQND